MPEPALDSDVLEIFEEFKKGLEKELGDEDAVTHYNLGIGYKEMGLLDEAVSEFQLTAGHPEFAGPAPTVYQSSRVIYNYFNSPRRDDERLR